MDRAVFIRDHFARPQVCAVFGGKGQPIDRFEIFGRRHVQVPVIVSAVVAPLCRGVRTEHGDRAP